MTLDVDLAREQNIEELRRFAQALQAQNQLLLEVLATKSREIERLRGQPGELQLTLKLIEALQAKVKSTEAAAQRAAAEQKKRAAERERKLRSGRAGRPDRLRNRCSRSSSASSRSTMPIECVRAVGAGCAR